MLASLRLRARQLQMHNEQLHTRHPKHNIISGPRREYVVVGGKRELVIVICLATVPHFGVHITHLL
jgi:hypothetical protein